MLLLVVDVVAAVVTSGNLVVLLGKQLHVDLVAL